MKQRITTQVDKDYETLKFRLSTVSDKINQKYNSTILRRRITSCDLVVKEFNEFFKLASSYIGFIVDNEMSKINAALAFFNDGFKYKNGNVEYISSDIHSLLSIYLQLLTESFTEYSFLHDGKAKAFSHANDLNCTINVEKIHSKIDRSNSAYTALRIFDEISDLKHFRNTMISESPCTNLSYHSLYLMYHVTNEYLRLKTKNKQKLFVDYNPIEEIDNKLNEFNNFLKKQVRQNVIYFQSRKLSVIVIIKCDSDSLDKKDCFIKYSKNLVCILQYLFIYI
jgi:hypothetical protein